MSDLISVPTKLLNQYLLCPLCKDYYTDPVTLTECLSPHTFCRKCLLDRLKQKFACPICNIYISGDIVHRIYNDELTDRNISGLVDLIPQEFKKAMDGNALVVTSTNPDKAIPPKSVTIFLSEWDEDENVAVDGANEKCNNHHCAMKLQLKTNLKMIHLMAYVELRLLKEKIIALEEIMKGSSQTPISALTNDNEAHGNGGTENEAADPEDKMLIEEPSSAVALDMNTELEKLNSLKQRLQLTVDFVQNINEAFQADDDQVLELINRFQPSIQLSIRGANVVVNDPGAAMSGEASDAPNMVEYYPCPSLRSIGALIDSYSLNPRDTLFMKYRYIAGS